jgi:Domain of unknown function (DUF4340)
MKRYLKTVAALVVLGALWASITYYNKRKSQESSKSSEPPKEMILPVKADQVESITVTPRDGEAFTCVRDNKTWAITEPRKLAADQSEVSSFVENLVGTSVNSVVDAHPGSLKDFGLDPPATTLSVSTTGKPAQFTLRIGDPTPTNDAVYAEVAGNPRLITLPSYGKSTLEKTLFDLRDRRVMTLDADQIQRLEVSDGAKSYKLAKNPDGQWDLVLPPPVRADNFAVDNLVSQFRARPMMSILAEDKKNSGQYGFGNPTLTVKLTSAAGAQTIVVGKKDGSNYDAMNSALDPVFTIGGDFVTALQKDPADLRDKNLFSFSSFDAKTIDITTAKDHRVFQQKDFKWKQTQPSAKDEPTDKMQDLLNALSDLRAFSFPKATPGNFASFGLAKPLYTIKATFGDKNRVETVEIGSAGDKYYARRDPDPVPGEVPKAQVDSIDKALGAL